jgi:hypothetical protein
LEQQVVVDLEVVAELLTLQRLVVILGSMVRLSQHLHVVPKADWLGHMPVRLDQVELPQAVLVIRNTVVEMEDRVAHRLRLLAPMQEVEVVEVEVLLDHMEMAMEVEVLLQLVFMGMVALVMQATTESVEVPRVKPEGMVQGGIAHTDRVEAARVQMVMAQVLEAESLAV